MRLKKRKLHPLVIAVIILLLFALLLCASVVGLWIHGRSTMTQVTQAPTLPPQTEPVDAENAPVDTVFEHNGKRYKYNSNMVNLLLLGIDSEEKPDEYQGGCDQADVIVLAALNLKDNKMSLISLSRDIICEIEATDNDGNNAGLIQTQLALTYGYGDGQHESCEATRDAVSNIFYGLPIQGYAAYYMNGIVELNDAVGGVTVTIIEDYPFSKQGQTKHWVEGAKITLNGKWAEYYIRARVEYGVDSNDLRMVRQKQYMLALVNKAIDKVKENPASILKIYDAVDDYVLTDLDIGEISYLATKAAGMDFSGEIQSLSGELILGKDELAELHVDQDALFDLMLDTFYIEVT